MNKLFLLFLVALGSWSICFTQSTKPVQVLEKEIEKIEATMDTERQANQSTINSLNTLAQEGKSIPSKLREKQKAIESELQENQAELKKLHSELSTLKQSKK